jgi:hypothetical protein
MTTMKIRLCLLLVCAAGSLLAQDEIGANSPRIIRYLQSLSDADLGKKLAGVRLPDGSTVLAGHTLLHRIELPSRRAHVYVFRTGSLAIGMPTARTWVEPKGKLLPIPPVARGDQRESAYLDGEVYTYSDVHPGDGVVEIAFPSETWIKSLQERSAAGKWGVETMAEINDPDGYTNVRDEDGKVIATVKAAERFLAVKPFEKATQWEVWLASGVVGLMHESRVRPLPDEPLMRLNFEPCKPEWKRAAAERNAEAIKSHDKPHPDDYYPTLLRASEGDISALSRFFSRKFEDAPADRYVRDAWAVLHLAGDDRFAEMLTQQPPDDIDVGAMLSEEWTTHPISDGKKYLQRHFPRTYEKLYSK